MKLRAFAKLIIILTVTTLFFSCENSKNLNEKNSSVKLESIKVEKVTRGSANAYEINKVETILDKTNLGGESERFKTKTKSSNWSEVETLVSKINLAEISNWEAPTQERFHDGARITTLKIISNREEFISQAFDEGQPPVQLKELYDYLESLENQ